MKVHFHLKDVGFFLNICHIFIVKVNILWFFILPFWMKILWNY